jgi:hypothetical protein
LKYLSVFVVCFLLQITGRAQGAAITKENLLQLLTAVCNNTAGNNKIREIDKTRSVTAFPKNGKEKNFEVILVKQMNGDELLQVPLSNEGSDLQPIARQIQQLLKDAWLPSCVLYLDDISLIPSISGDSVYFQPVQAKGTEPVELLLSRMKGSDDKKIYVVLEIVKYARIAQATVAKDMDGDGVPDSEDGCPAVKGDKKNKGCPAQPEKKPEVKTTPATVKSAEPPKTVVPVKTAVPKENSIVIKKGTKLIYGLSNGLNSFDLTITIQEAGSKWVYDWVLTDEDLNKNTGSVSIGSNTISNATNFKLNITDQSRLQLNGLTGVPFLLSKKLITQLKGKTGSAVFSLDGKEKLQYKNSQEASRFPLTINDKMVVLTGMEVLGIKEGLTDHHLVIASHPVWPVVMEWQSPDYTITLHEVINK